MARTLSVLEGTSVRLSAARRYIRPSDSPGAPPDIPPASRQYILSRDCGHSQMEGGFPSMVKDVFPLPPMGHHPRIVGPWRQPADQTDIEEHSNYVH